MAHVNADLVRETTATTGTGNYALAGAQQSFRAFSAAMLTGDTCWYAARFGTDYELGIGTFTSPSTLARTTIIGSSNSNNAVSWAAGAKDIYITTPSREMPISRRLAKTAAYTVVNADKHGVIVLGGNAFYQLTVSAASGYDANHAFTVYNEDTTRGKRIAPNGLSSFILYPLQVCRISNQNNVWSVERYEKRWRPSTAHIVHVHPTLGNDLNDGLATGSGNALLTFQAAANVLMSTDHWEGGASIQLADGVHSGANFHGSIVGATAYVVEGNPTTPANCEINVAAAATCVISQDHCGVTINGVRLTGGTGATGLLSRQQAIIDFLNVEFGAMPSGTHISSTEASACSCVGNYAIVGDAALHVAASFLGWVHLGAGTVTIASARSFTQFASASFGGVIDGTPTYSGAGVAGTLGQRFSELDGHVSSSVTYPGNAAGQSFIWPVGLGTVSLPVYSRAGDSDTGLYFPAADRLAITCGGTARATFGGTEGPSGAAFMANVTTTGLANANFQNTQTAGIETIMQFYDGAPTLCGVITISTTANTTAYTTSSGHELKTKFDESGIDWGRRIDEIWVGDYERKSEPGVVELGYVAEWTQKHLPWAVIDAKQKDADGNVSIMKMVDYGRTAPLALWGVKNARERIAVLENEIADLRAEMKRRLPAPE